MEDLDAYNIFVLTTKKRHILHAIDFEIFAFPYLETYLNFKSKGKKPHASMNVFLTNKASNETSNKETNKHF